MLREGVRFDDEERIILHIILFYGKRKDATLEGLR